MSAKLKDKTIWCDRGWMPTYYGFCPSEKAWKREMKRLGDEGVPIPDAPYPTSDGCCTTFVNDTTGKVVCLVTIANHLDDADDPVGIVTLIAHEAVHVWQAIREDIGEEAPSVEFEAYAIQNISAHLLEAYSKTRGKQITANISKEAA